MPGRTPFGTSVVNRWPSSSLNRSCWPGFAPGGQMRVRGATMVSCFAVRYYCSSRLSPRECASVPRARRRRFGAALSPGEAALSLETAILSSRPTRRRRRGPVAGRPHSCGTKQGAHAGGNCRWPLHQQRRRCDSRASAISAAPNGLRASTATSEPTPDAKRPPTPKRSPGGVAAAPPSDKNGPLQGADAGDRAERDAAREDAR